MPPFWKRRFYLNRKGNVIELEEIQDSRIKVHENDQSNRNESENLFDALC